MSQFNQWFPHRPIIGMIHLKALPGSPAYQGSMTSIIDAALADLEALARGGVDGALVENFFDTPFFKDHVGAETVAAMTRVTTILRQQTGLPLGVNVLRNDALSAMAIASACDCQFIRANQLSWAMLTDQGIIEGKAAELLRLRRSLGSQVMVWADCLSKHAASLTPQTMELVALDTWERGGADALIVSGVATGRATDIQDVRDARRGAPDAPILIGSGVTPENALALLDVANAIMVGTYFKQEGRVDRPVDESRVRELVKLVKEAPGPV